MIDPTEYEPNSRDITDDPNFLSFEEDSSDLKEENAQLRKERDEARREICELYLKYCVYGIETRNQYVIASIKGWDCYRGELETQ